ncbi:hypothetical protein DFH08DRAFT_971858 [Mycena albidolilacea]|uniref:Uncharacterized protein n=1 Tax=Mycena albidolilacea TaxID=1033008 RepID=A0AAD6ZCH6_9AGAR|nr:hypothetical protein DFH08DRAFT_971858 [Mycena albidolilacea]
MSRQIFLAFLLRVINYTFGVHFILAPEAPPDNEEEGWYMISWGLLSRDRDWLLFLQKPSDDARAIEPIYFARTFEDALKYLPLCEAFQDAFALDDTGRWVNKKPLYYVVDNDGEIYYTSEAAKNACQRQPDNGVICVLTSEHDAQARTDGYPDDY